MLTLQLPQLSQDMIDNYFKLKIGNKIISTPYYINEKYDEKHKKAYPISSDVSRFKKRTITNRALVGKGSPKDIENIVHKYATRDDFNLQTASISEIREFMMIQGIGIDCSGFVVWVLNEAYMQKQNQPIWKFLEFKKNLLRKILILLRPVENISVQVLGQNSRRVTDISTIQPGDLIISWSSSHVLLVSKVTFGKNKKPISFEYINATWWYGKENGVRRGIVKIVQPKGMLKEQLWLDDVDDKKKNWTYEGIKNGSQLVRLKSRFEHPLFLRAE